MLTLLGTVKLLLAAAATCHHLATAAATTTAAPARQLLVAAVASCHHLTSASAASSWSEFPQPEENERSYVDDFVFPDRPRKKKQLTTSNHAIVVLSPSPPSADPFSSPSQPPPSSSGVSPFGLAKIHLPPPSGCGLEDYCEHVSDYPDPELIKQLIRNQTVPNDPTFLFFDPPKELLQTQNRPTVPLAQGIDTQPRLGPGASRITTEDVTATLPGESRDNYNYSPEFIQEVAVCDSHETFIYPRTARNVQNEFRYVINLPEEDDFKQAVKVEKCLNPGNPCNIYSSTGTETVCRQKYSYKRMVALTTDGVQYVDTFRFPSCCVCYEKKPFAFGDLELLRTAEKTATLLPIEDEGQDTTTINTLGDTTSPEDSLRDRRTPRNTAYNNLRNTAHNRRMAGGFSRRGFKNSDFAFPEK